MKRWRSEDMRIGAVLGPDDQPQRRTLADWWAAFVSHFRSDDAQRTRRNGLGQTGSYLKVSS